MNRDLEELAPELKTVAARLQAAPQATVRPGFAAGVMAAVAAERQAARADALRRRWLAVGLAASVVVLLGAAILFRSAEPAPPPRILAAKISSGAAPYLAAQTLRRLAEDPAADPARREAAVAAVIRTQHADGGWTSPTLSALNTAALRLAAEAGSSTAANAWKRGLRYLRANGLPETNPFTPSLDKRFAAWRTAQE